MSTKRLKLTVKTPTRRAEDWVTQDTGTSDSGAPSKAQVYTARLTLDITTDLRKRIKLAALSGGTTVANLLRELLEREFAKSPDREP